MSRLRQPFVTKVVVYEGSDWEDPYFTLHYMDVPGFSGCPPGMDTAGNILWCDRVEDVPLLLEEVSGAFRMARGKLCEQLVYSLPETIEFLKGSEERIGGFASFLRFLHDCLLALQSAGRLPDWANPEVLSDIAEGVSSEGSLKAYSARANVTPYWVWERVFGAIAIVFDNSRLLEKY